jgi:hypothetical protein
MKLLQQFALSEYRMNFAMTNFVDQELFLALEGFRDKVVPVDLYGAKRAATQGAKRRGVCRHPAHMGTAVLRCKARPCAGSAFVPVAWRPKALFHLSHCFSRLRFPVLLRVGGRLFRRAGRVDFAYLGCGVGVQCRDCVEARTDRV